VSFRKVMDTEGGFTLLEVIVASILVGLLAIPLMMFGIKGLQSYTFLQTQSQTSTDLSTLSERIAKVVRGATSVITASANTLTIYGYFDPADTKPEQIRYFVSGTNLDIGETDPVGTAPNYTYPPANEVVTVAYTHLVMGATPMFTYYDSTGTILPTGFVNSEVMAVGIYVAANPTPGQNGTAISISTLATLRNFKTNL
jgi:prepilin-type N-terminal cleavage/methylation domain-containing protein